MAKNTETNKYSEYKYSVQRILRENFSREKETEVRNEILSNKAILKRNTFFRIINAKSTDTYEARPSCLIHIAMVLNKHIPNKYIDLKTLIDYDNRQSEIELSKRLRTH